MRRPSKGSGNSPAGYVSTIATSACSTASLPPSKASSRNGPNPMMLYGDYAQLLKTLCLTQVGHDVTVLEARTRPGGRVHTLRDAFAEGLYAEAGATRVPNHHHFTIKYVELFGLTLDSFEPSDLPSVYYVRGGRIQVRPGQKVEWPHALTPGERALGVDGMRQKYIWSMLSELGDTESVGAGEPLRAGGFNEGRIGYTPSGKAILLASSPNSLAFWRFDEEKGLLGSADPTLSLPEKVSGTLWGSSDFTVAGDTLVLNPRGSNTSQLQWRGRAGGKF